MQWKRIDLPVLLPKAQAEKELRTLRLNKQAKKKFFQCYRKLSREIQNADTLKLSEEKTETRQQHLSLLST